jgi:hypothetical protein
MSVERSGVNLFVYGSLAEAGRMRTIVGEEFPRVAATIADFAKVEQSGFFTYITPESGASLAGVAVLGLTPAALRQLDDYEQEGVLYSRRLVCARLGTGRHVEAFAYVGIPENILPLVARGFTKDEQLGDFIEGRIRGSIETQARTYSWQEIAAKVQDELVDEAVDELRQEYTARPDLPEFFIRRRLSVEQAPRLDWLATTPEARPYARKYMDLTTRLVVLNTLARRIRRDLRTETQVPGVYFPHARSVYAAARFLNEEADALASGLAEIVRSELEETTSGVGRVDYVRLVAAAIVLAEELYGPPVVGGSGARDRVRAILGKLENTGCGCRTQLGMELEFSQVGHDCLTAAPGDDPDYDCFYWFNDYDLARRGWKLGCHIDDHGFITGDRGRVRGFLEVAYGRYRIVQDLSRPVTNDVRFLSGLAQETVRYLGLRPHSLHLSLEVDRAREFAPFPSVDWFICLLMLGGDLSVSADGRLREMRIFRSEIINPKIGLTFSRHNTHRSEKGTARVVEYQFPRLFPDHDYEPLMCALVGLKSSLNPFPLKENGPGFAYAQLYDRFEAELLSWSGRPWPVPEASIVGFVEAVEQGVRNDGFAPGYVREIVAAVATQLAEKNQLVAESTRATPKSYARL